MRHLRAVRQRTSTADPEAGSTLAAVIGVVAVTGVTAIALLASVVFGSGFASASRAGVQARAAAEAGIHFALANVDRCDPGTRRVSTPAAVGSATTLPDFTVEFVAYRTDPRGQWIDGATQVADKACPPPNAVAIRLVSTGRADTDGAPGHSRGDVRSMEAVAVAEFPYAIFGEALLEIGSGHSAVKDSAAAPASFYANGLFSCTGKLTLHGSIYVRSKNSTDFVAKGECKQEDFIGGVQTTGGLNPQHPASAFPVLRATDPRWPSATRPHLASSVTRCSLIDTQLTLSRTTVRVQKDVCPLGVTLRNATIRLTGDVVILADKVDVTNLTALSGDGRVHSLYVVKPSEQTTCVSQTADIQISGLSAGPKVKAMVYGSTGVRLHSATTATASATNTQIYACAVTTANNIEISYAPVGRMIIASERDVTR